METITARLQISHGNCSTSIRDLLAWNSIRRVHVPGERRVLYESEQDPWTWFHACIRERRRREVIPVIDQLHEISDHAKTTADVADSKRSADAKDLKQAYERIARFTKFMDEFKDLIDAFLAVGAGPMGKALRMAAKVLPKGK
jgi:DNA-binding transcriptional regulator GbsR (MarR family)